MSPTFNVTDLWKYYPPTEKNQQLTIAHEEGLPDAVHTNHILEGLEDNDPNSNGPEQTQELAQEWLEASSLLEPACSISEHLTLTLWNCPLYTM